MRVRTVFKKNAARALQKVKFNYPIFWADFRETFKTLSHYLGLCGLFQEIWRR